MRGERPRKGGRSLRAGERKEWSGLGRRGGTGLRVLGPGQGYWVGLLLGLGFVGFSSFLFLFTLSFLFLIQTKFEFKYKFEFQTTLK